MYECVVKYVHTLFQKTTMKNTKNKKARATDFLSTMRAMAAVVPQCLAARCLRDFKWLLKSSFSSLKTYSHPIKDIMSLSSLASSSSYPEGHIFISVSKNLVQYFRDRFEVVFFDELWNVF
jgi:hypothetical protein